MKNVLGGCVLCAALAVLQTVSRPVRADDAAVDATAAKQRALYEQGNKLYDEKKWKEAEEAFRAVFAMKKSYDVAGNLGDVELINGKARDAAEHLALSLREFPAGGKPALRERLTKRLGEARALVGALRIEVNKAGAEVFVDGRSIGIAPLSDEVFVEPGARVVEARFEGYMVAREAFTIEKGAAREVRLSLVAAPAAQAAPTPPSGSVAPNVDNHSRRSIVPAVVLGGVAVAGLAGGIALLVVGQAKRSRAQELNAAITAAHGSCRVGSPIYDARCVELHDVSLAADPLHHAGIGVTVGAVLAAAGAATYLLWPAPKAAPRPSVRVAPVVTGGSGGLMAAGTF